MNAISKLTNNLIILGVGSFWVPLTFLFYLDNHTSQICLNNADRKFLIATKQEIPSKWNSKQNKNSIYWVWTLFSSPFILEMERGTTDLLELQTGIQKKKNISFPLEIKSYHLGCWCL